MASGLSDHAWTIKELIERGGGGGVMTKSLYEKVSDFVDHWSSDQAGRFEFLLDNGERIVIHDCQLCRDMANRPDRILVNYDTDGQPHLDFDPLEVVAINDLEQSRAVVEK